MDVWVIVSFTGGVRKLRPLEMPHTIACDMVGKNRPKAIDKLRARLWMRANKLQEPGELWLTVGEDNRAIGRSLDTAMKLAELRRNVGWLFMGFVHGMRVATPNDPKLSDSGVRRGTCTVGGKAAVVAGAVTHGAVRCSAWLGVAVIWSSGKAACHRAEWSNLRAA